MMTTKQGKVVCDKARVAPHVHLNQQHKKEAVTTMCLVNVIVAHVAHPTPIHHSLWPH